MFGRRKKVTKLAELYYTLETEKTDVVHLRIRPRKHKNYVRYEGPEKLKRNLKRDFKRKTSSTLPKVFIQFKMSSHYGECESKFSYVLLAALNAVPEQTSLKIIFDNFSGRKKELEVFFKQLASDKWKLDVEFLDSMSSYGIVDLFSLTEYFRGMKNLGEIKFKYKDQTIPLEKKFILTENKIKKIDFGNSKFSENFTLTLAKMFSLGNLALQSVDLRYAFLPDTSFIYLLLSLSLSNNLKEIKLSSGVNLYLLGTGIRLILDRQEINSLEILNFGNFKPEQKEHNPGNSKL
eukprot:snap_masked-scaffold_41-processed-gene-1.18-mRNA-1 protein AED:1.00 eAED:1.00 QI:0/0/0/0/1/1/2/0/291